jgi:3-methyladenine DNA glycosylase AlkD
MTAAEIVAELQTLGSASIKKVLLKHGAKEPIYGVKIEDLKKIQKRVKKNHALALELYDTGISDAMYLAGLIADDAQMTKEDLQRWVEQASWYMVGEYTVPWVAAGSKFGHELALEWIDAPQPHIAASGWATLSSLVALKEDKDLNLPELKRLLQRVQKTIHAQPQRVPYVMNGFIIAVGSYVPKLTDVALQVADKIGTVEVDMGDTACKVPSAREYIQKVQQRGTLGKKRKTVKC